MKVGTFNGVALLAIWTKNFFLDFHLIVHSVTSNKLQMHKAKNRPTLVSGHNTEIVNIKMYYMNETSDTHKTSRTHTHNSKRPTHIKRYIHIKRHMHKNVSYRLNVTLTLNVPRTKMSHTAKNVPHSNKCPTHETSDNLKV